MEEQQTRDARYLEAIEELTQNLWRCKEKYNLTEEENGPFFQRLKLLEEKLITERRLLEEISRPCRFILEHFTTFMGKSDHTVGFSMGQLESGRGNINDFSIKEWGNVCLVIGNISISWRDEDYQYLFYPDKVILRSVDRSKPEIHLMFNFAFKYSKILDGFEDVATDPQTFYCHPDLFAADDT